MHKFDHPEVYYVETVRHETKITTGSNALLVCFYVAMHFKAGAVQVNSIR